MRRVPPPRGRCRRAAPRADLRLVLRPLSRRRPERARGRRRAQAGDEDHASRAGSGHVVRGGAGRLQPAAPGRDRRARARRGRLRRRQRAHGEGDARGRHGASTRASPTSSRCPATRTCTRWCSPGLYPTDTTQYEGLRDALEKLQLNDASLQLRARDVHRARLRLPLRLPRAAAHGDRAGAARARVRSRPRHDGAERGVPRLPHRRHDGAAREPGASCPTPARSTASRSRT